MPFTDHPRLRLAAVSACLVLAATACGGRDGEPSSAQPGSEPTQPTASASLTPEPTVSATPTDDAEPTASASPETLEDRLLPTGDVPGLNATWEWQDGETGPAGAEPFGLCAKVDLASIGATEVVERSYFPPVDSDDSAGEQIAEFPDTKSVAQATAVLKSWRTKCKAFLGKAGSKIGSLTPVTVPTGTGAWYLVSYPEGGDEGRFHAFGFVASGTRIAVLSIDNGGQDYNYPAGKEPMVAMVRAAAARLG